MAATNCLKVSTGLTVFSPATRPRRTEGDIPPLSPRSFFLSRCSPRLSPLSPRLRFKITFSVSQPIPPPRRRGMFSLFPAPDNSPFSHNTPTPAPESPPHFQLSFSPDFNNLKL